MVYIVTFMVPYLNFFHIFFVSVLLYALSSNLKPGHETLAMVTQIIAVVMVIYHSYRAYGKLSDSA